MLKFLKLIMLSTAVVSLQTCSWSSKKFETFSHPNTIPPLSLSQDFKKLTFVASGDLRGRYFSEKEVTGLKGLPPFEFNVGGVNTLAGYLEILKKQNRDNLVHLHLGNSLGEDPSDRDLQIMDNVLKKLDVSAALFGAKELTQKETTFESTNYVNSNILNLRTLEPYSSSNVMPFKIFEKNGVKVGVIGVTSYDVVSEKKKKKIRGYYFEDPALSLLKVKERLEEEGVKITVLMMRTSSECESHFEPSIKSGNRPQDNQIKCNQEKGLLNLIRRLPPRSIDLVIASGETPVYGYVGRMPVIQNPNDGKFISKVSIYFDQNNKRIDPDLTQVFAPTKLCSKFLMATNDCHPYHKEEQLADILASGEESSIRYIQAKYLGEEVKFKKILID